MKEHFVDDLPLRVVDQLIFQQDGTPPHNARQVVEYLNAHFGDRWMGTNKVARKITRLDTSGLLSMGSREKPNLLNSLDHS